MSTLSCTCCAHVCSVTSSSPSSFLYSLPPASNVFRSITALFRLFSAQRVHRWLLRLVLLLPGVDAGFAKVIRQYLNGTLSYRPHSSVASFVGLQEPTRILGSTPRSSPLASIPGLAAAPTWSHLVKWGSCTPDLGLSPYVSDSNSGRPSRHRQLLDNLVASDTLLLPPLPIQFEYPQLRINDVSLSPSQVVPSYNGFPRNKVATVPPNYRTELISQQPNSPRELEDQPYFAPILHHIKESYCINGLLGEGSFGRVLHATTSQGKAVAIKGVHKHFMYGSVGGRKCLLTEKEVMRRATLTDKKFLSNLLASWDDGEFVYFVMVS